ncbi:MAG: amidohydrolase family protein, partial [bacterium]|nr:amidohydrolase family protein [bacterium]
MKAIRLLSAILLTCSLVSAQTTPVSPVDGIRTKTPNQVALTPSFLIISPDETIENGLLLIEADHILYSGPREEIPAGYAQIDLTGYTIYPGFIDSYTDYGINSERSASQTGGNRDLKFDADRKGGNAWNDAIHAQIDWVSSFEPDERESDELMKVGFTTVHSCRLDGLFRGRGFVTHLGSGLPNDLILAPYTYHFLSFDKGTSRQEYPNSLMGSIALIRQMYFDVDWYQQAHRAYEHNSAQPLPEFNSAIESLARHRNESALFETNDELSLLRAARIAQELSLDFVQVGSGFEYAWLSQVAEAAHTIILPVAFPEPPAVSAQNDELDVSLADLRHWETAPYNPARLDSAGVELALTTHKQQELSQFLANVRKSIEHGWSRTEALAALTTKPAELLQIADKVGTLTKGKLADFTITDGDIFDEETSIYSVWISGQQNEIKEMPTVDLSGNYQLEFSGLKYPLSLSGELDDISGEIRTGEETLELTNLSIRDGQLSFSIDFDSLPPTGLSRFEGRLTEGALTGYTTDAKGDRYFWTAGPMESDSDTATSAMADEEITDVSSEPIAKLTHPNISYGVKSVPKPEDVLITNATIWTSEDEGILKTSDLLIRDGKIAAVGRELQAPKGVRVIDGTGKHLTAGIIDPHSHIAISGNVNECTEAVTAEVRIGDVVNPAHIAIYRQLAGGTTAALSLHGSCNAIGGEAQLIKLRWGEDSEGLKFKDAPCMIKFALGENVKRSSWGPEHRIRYPQTRMGVESITRDAFQAA